MTTPPTNTDEPTTGTVKIEGEVNHDDSFFSPGIWQVAEGADVLRCEGATLTEFDSDVAVANELTCRNAFIGSSAPSEDDPGFRSSWDVIVASGDFSNLSGIGKWSGTFDANRQLDVCARFGDELHPKDRFCVHTRILRHTVVG
jgi:hypothetical protein